MFTQFSRRRFMDFLTTHCHRPVSISYQSDCTPSTTQEVFACTNGDKKVVRAGKRSSDYLLHRVFARASSGEQCVHIGFPHNMADKTTMTHVNASYEYLFYPFRRGSRTINITHVCFDGALFQPLSSALYSDHDLKLEAEINGLDGDGAMLRLSSGSCEPHVPYTVVTTASNGP